MCSDCDSKERCDPCKRCSLDAIAKLQDYNWPGNIRELKSIVRRTLILADGDTITASAILDEYMPRTTPNPLTLVPNSATLDVPPDDARPTSDGKPFEVTEKRLIEEALRECGGNLTATAIRLQIGRATLYRKIKKYGIDVVAASLAPTAKSSGF